jgi:hypothetical protein
MLLYQMLIALIQISSAHVQGYLPLPSPLRIPTLSRKREEYGSLVELAFARGREGLDQQVWHQIEIDVPRTRPGVKLWMFETTQRVRTMILLYCDPGQSTVNAVH